MFVVVTTDGTMVNKGRDGSGLSEEAANQDAERRSVEAEKMGLEVRYAVQEKG